MKESNNALSTKLSNLQLKLDKSITDNEKSGEKQQTEREERGKAACLDSPEAKKKTKIISTSSRSAGKPETIIDERLAKLDSLDEAKGKRREALLASVTLDDLLKKQTNTIGRNELLKQQVKKANEIRDRYYQESKMWKDRFKFEEVKRYDCNYHRVPVVGKVRDGVFLAFKKAIVN